MTSTDIPPPNGNHSTNISDENNGITDSNDGNLDLFYILMFGSPAQKKLQLRNELADLESRYPEGRDDVGLSNEDSLDGQNLIEFVLNISHRLQKEALRMEENVGKLNDHVKNLLEAFDFEPKYLEIVNKHAKLKDDVGMVSEEIKTLFDDWSVVFHELKEAQKKLQAEAEAQAQAQAQVQVQANHSKNNSFATLVQDLHDIMEGRDTPSEEKYNALQSVITDKMNELRLRCTDGKDKGTDEPQVMQMQSRSSSSPSSPPSQPSLPMPPSQPSTPKQCDQVPQDSEATAPAAASTIAAQTSSSKLLAGTRAFGTSSYSSQSTASGKSTPESKLPQPATHALREAKSATGSGVLSSSKYAFQPTAFTGDNKPPKPVVNLPKVTKATSFQPIVDPKPVVNLYKLPKPIVNLPEVAKATPPQPTTEPSKDTKTTKEEEGPVTLKHLKRLGGLGASKYAH